MHVVLSIHSSYTLSQGTTRCGCFAAEIDVAKARKDKFPTIKAVSLAAAFVCALCLFVTLLFVQRRYKSKIQKKGGSDTDSGLSSDMSQL